MRSWKTEVILLLCMTASAPPVREAAPTEWPLERIVKNLEARLKEAPNDAEAHDNLGRAYAFAFTLKRSTLWTRGDWIDDLDQQDRKSPKRRDPTLRLPPPSEDERLVQLAQGMKHLLRACELAPKEARFRLTLAWFLETGSPLGDRVDGNTVFALRASEVQAEERASIERWISDLTSSDAAIAKAARANLCDHEHLEHAAALLSSKTVGATAGPAATGSASAWLFFSDGYRVLDALDDDRDGELRGAELAGIAVWFDGDTDGVSDRGEVVPVEELGIVALSTQSTLVLGSSPANLCGLELEDGRVLPTYDWVLEPVAAP